MFLIVPKKAINTSPAAPPLAPRMSDQTLTRVPNACDVCRNRKVKCDGGMPCLKCSKCENVCTYSQFHQKRTGERTPVGRNRFQYGTYFSVATDSINLQYENCLLRQQKRLFTALRTMAAVIDDQQASGQPVCTDLCRRSQQDMNDILAKYAPLPDADTPTAFQTQVSPPPSLKKRKYEEAIFDTRPQPTKQSKLAAEIENDPIVQTSQELQSTWFIPGHPQGTGSSFNDPPLPTNQAIEDGQQFQNMFDENNFMDMIDWDASWRHWTEAFLTTQ